MYQNFAAVLRKLHTWEKGEGVLKEIKDNVIVVDTLLKEIRDTTLSTVDTKLTSIQNDLDCIKTDSCGRRLNDNELDGIEVDLDLYLKDYTMADLDELQKSNGRRMDVDKEEKTLESKVGSKLEEMDSKLNVMEAAIEAHQAESNHKLSALEVMMAQLIEQNKQLLESAG